MVNLSMLDVNMIWFTFPRKSEMAKKQHGGKRPNSGRPSIHPEGETTTVAAKVPKALVDRLDVVAEKNEWSRSEAITEAIRGLLKRRERRTGVTIPSAEADPSDRV